MCVPASQSLMSPSLGVQILVTNPRKKTLGLQYLFVCVRVFAWMLDVALICGLCVHLIKNFNDCSLPALTESQSPSVDSRCIKCCHIKIQIKSQYQHVMCNSPSRKTTTSCSVLHTTRAQSFSHIPCSPSVSGIVTLPRFESLSLGDE